VLQFLFEGIVVSLIVQIMLLPLSVVYFNRISPGSVIFNIWVGILLTAESVTAVLTIVVGAFSDVAAGPLAALTNLLNQLMVVVPDVLAEAGLGSRRLPAYSLPLSAVYAVFYLPLVAIAVGLERWDPFSLKSGKSVQKIAIASVLILSLIVGTSPYAANAPDGRLSVEFIDVGQGDSALVTFPDGRTMLIDGGGRPDYRETADDAESGFEPDRITIGESVVSRFLWNRGLASIDYLVATHADADHIQGLADIAKNFDVRCVFVGRDATGDKDFDALMAAAKRKGIDVRALRRGDALRIAGAEIDVLHPRERRGSPNDDSLVLRLTFDRIRFLLTGDIESDAENLLIGSNADLRADVVKVAHHGSKTSSSPEFVSATGAKYAVVPVGLKSPFGHPAESVLGRWTAIGANVMTTGRHGTISFRTNGRDLVFTTHVK
jgi:competence protein ComEC